MDSNIFTFEQAARKFQIHTTDLGAVGIYSISITVYHSSYPSQSAWRTFLVTITDPCAGGALTIYIPFGTPLYVNYETKSS